MSKFDINMIFAELMKAYSANDLNKAIRIAEDAYISFPYEKEDTLYWKACLYSANGMLEKAIEIFNEAIDNKIWWSPKIIENENDFNNVRNNKLILNAIKKMEGLYQKTQKLSSVKTFFSNNDTGNEYIVNLHKWNDNVHNYRKYFDSYFRKNGLNCLYVQSSQVSSSKGFYWDNAEQNLRDCDIALEAAKIRYATICGTSQGGNVAFQYAIKHKKNYIGIMPALRFKECSFDEIKTDKKFTFIIGNKDDFFEDVLKIEEYFRKNGVKSKFINMEGVGHYFPDNFFEYLDQSGMKSFYGAERDAGR